MENHISYSEVPRETGGECPTSGRVRWPQWFLARLLRQLKVSLCLPENRGARLSFAKQKSVLQSLGSDLLRETIHMIHMMTYQRQSNKYCINTTNKVLIGLIKGNQWLLVP